VAVTTQVLRAKKTITAFGNAQVDTAQSKFGGASALFDGNGDYLTIANTAGTSPFTLRTSDHTIECWVRLDSSINNRNTIISNGLTSFTTNWMKLGIDLSDGNYYVFFTAYDYSSGGSPMMYSSPLSTQTWYHIALVRKDTEWFLYVDGVLAQSNTTSTAKGITANWAANDITQIGRYSFDNGTNPSSTYFDGNIDELRISNVARYTANFTPATSAFTPDDNTLLLLHMDGTNNSTTFTDSTT
jgi:hypothetical protein